MCDQGSIWILCWTLIYFPMFGEFSAIISWNNLYVPFSFISDPNCSRWIVRFGILNLSETLSLVLFFNVWVFPWNQLFFIIFSAGDTFWYIFIWLIVSFTNFLFGSFYYLYYLLNLSSDFGLSPLIYHLFHFGNFLGQEYIFLFSYLYLSLLCCNA